MDSSDDKACSAFFISLRQSTVNLFLCYCDYNLFQCYVKFNFKPKNLVIDLHALFYLFTMDTAFSKPSSRGHVLL